MNPEFGASQTDPSPALAASLRRGALAAILLLAALLRFSNLEALGYGNRYYTAAVTGMLQSWSNFFFVAAEPGGAVSVDKPPLGLWVQTLSAAIFGVNGFGVLLPQLLAGIASVAVLYHLVRRRFGAIAGLLAALTLAITPVVVATDRNNTMDSQLILVLLLASWAFIKATESAKLGYLLLGALLVGVGFNIKMLQAYLVLPACYALYFCGSPERVWRKVWHLTLASVLLGVVSFSWAVIVDLTPTELRPYVGSSEGNRVFNLIVGYNGIQRLLGMGGMGGPMNNAPPPDGVGQPTDGVGQPTDGVGNRPRHGPGGPPGNGDGPGGFNIGERGVLRLFIAPLNKETSWLLPFAIFAGGLLAVGAAWRWPLGPKHQALTLWGGWLLTAGVFFSVGNFFHEYYLSMLAAPLAALVGLGVAELWQIHCGGKKGFAVGLLVSTAAVTLGLQAVIGVGFTHDLTWLWVAGTLLLFGATLLILDALLGQVFTRSGFALVVSALLVAPGVWSVWTMQNPSANASLPSAYSGEPSGQTGLLEIDQNLLDFLQANTQGVEYLMAVPSSMQGADYVIASGRPVLYLGGFNGNDPVLSTDELAALVGQGRLRYIYASERGNAQNQAASWAAAHCTVVDGFGTTMRNFGTPDGTGMGAQNPGEMAAKLYDCQAAMSKLGD